ncbi:MAG: DUF6364 family protein [Wenzhouxiangellaceae bacterium]|nr:DUF6364 family protein [Wenzhouxiangellaceae bacterium]
MKNITVSVDEECYRAARIVAAENNTSVSAMVREYLAGVAAARQRDGDATQALFDLMDRAGSLRAADRLSREQAHAR